MSIYYYPKGASRTTRYAFRKMQRDAFRQMKAESGREQKVTEDNELQAQLLTDSLIRVLEIVEGTENVTEIISNLKELKKAVSKSCLISESKKIMYSTIKECKKLILQGGRDLVIATMKAQLPKELL